MKLLFLLFSAILISDINAKQNKPNKKQLIATVFGQELYLQDLEQQLIKKYGEKYLKLSPKEKNILIQQLVSAKIFSAIVKHDPKSANVESMPEFKEGMDALKQQLVEQYYMKYIQNNFSLEEKQDAYEKYCANNNKVYKVGIIMVDSKEKAQGIVESLNNGNASVETFVKLHEENSVQFYKNFTKDGIFKDASASKLKTIFSSNELAAAISAFKQKGVVNQIVKFDNNYIVIQIFEVKKVKLPESFKNSNAEIQTEVLNSLFYEYQANMMINYRNNGQISINSEYFAK